MGAASGSRRRAASKVRTASTRRLRRSWTAPRAYRRSASRRSSSRLVAGRAGTCTAGLSPWGSWASRVAPAARDSRAARTGRALAGIGSPPLGDRGGPPPLSSRRRGPWPGRRVFRSGDSNALARLFLAGLHARPPGPVEGDPGLLGGRALSVERAGRAVRLVLPAVLLGDLADRVGERRPLGLGDDVLQRRPGRLGVVHHPLDQPQPAGAAQGRRVDGDGVAAQGALHHPGAHVLAGRPEPRQLLGRLLQPLLVQPLQVERERRLEHLLQERQQALGPALGAGQPLQGLLQLAHRADADLVPVEELLAEVAVGALGLLGGGALPAQAV